MSQTRVRDRRRIVSLGFLVASITIFTWLVWAHARQQPVYPGDVVINEFATYDPDWIKLFNRTSREIDLSGFILSDGHNVARLAPGTKIGSRDSLVILGEKHRGLVDHQSPKSATTWPDWGSTMMIVSSFFSLMLPGAKLSILYIPFR